MKIFGRKLSKLDFSSVKKEIFWWSGCGIFLFAIGKMVDRYVFLILHTEGRPPWMDQAIVFLTERLIWVFLIGFALVTTYRVINNPKHQSKLVPAFFAVITTGILSFILKSFFHVPRPYEILDIHPLVYASSFSFPSAHTAVAFSLLIPFFRLSKSIGILWAIFAVCIGFSRVYENVHFASDIAGGIFLGGIIGSFFSHPEIIKMVGLLWKEREFRRQSFHFVFGFLCVFMHWAGFLKIWQIAGLLVIGLIISLFSQFKEIPLISNVLKMFDRQRDKNFPGRGAFFFLLGVFLCILIFRKENLKIAYSAILILSVGDSLNHLFAAKYNKLKIPWNKRKNILGVGIGVLTGTFAAQFFVPLIPALLASSISILFETIPIKIGKYYVDDNVFVPLIAGGILWLTI